MKIGAEMTDTKTKNGYPKQFAWFADHDSSWGITVKTSKSNEKRRIDHVPTDSI